MALSALEATRDVIVIIWGVFSIIAFGLLIILLYSIWRGVKDLIKTVQTIAKDDVHQMIVTSQQSLNNITGTARFMSDTVVSPVVKAYGVVAGVRRGLAVFTGVTRRGKRRSS